MKTALQKLISKWESEMGSYMPNAPIYKAFIEEAKGYLEDEKEQIINAINAGLSGIPKSSDKYYNETYENNL
jgi:hypothetical protein